METKELMVNDKVFENTFLKKNCTVQVVEPDRVLLKEGKCYSMPNEIEPITFTINSAKKNNLIDCGDDIYQDDKWNWGIDFRNHEFYTFNEDVENTIKPILLYHELQHALRLVGLNNVADNLKV